MIIQKREVYRYLGYRNQKPDAETEKLVDQTIENLQKVIQPKNIQRRFQIKLEENCILFTDDRSSFEFESEDLVRNLKGCKEVILFAVTLGNGPDQLLGRYEVINIAKAAIVQAAAAMLVEAYCNELQETIGEMVQKEGYYQRPRFSPGYGDLSIQEQKKIFTVLECEKRIGLTLTDSMMMLPTKSVTGIIGLTKEANTCHIGKCKQCEKKDCEFRDE